MAKLTERQRQVVALLVLGKSNKEIARDLGISEGTVKVHLNGIYDRVGIRSRYKVATILYKEIIKHEANKQNSSVHQVREETEGEGPYYNY